MRGKWRIVLLIMTMVFMFGVVTPTITTGSGVISTNELPLKP
ncbi:hypothetical protein [Paenibacillus agri]|nr:hypothetical protein [Paenibacillus agri]